MLATFSQNNESSNCQTLLGITTSAHEGGLITSHTHLICSQTSLIGATLANGGLDTCSFYSGPSDETIAAFGESCGSIAYSDESCGSIAYSGESCGSIASSVSSFSGGCSVGGACSYSC